MAISSKHFRPSKKSLLIVAAAFVCGWLGAAGLVWSALRPKPYRTFPLPYHECLGLSASGATYLTTARVSPNGDANQFLMHVYFWDAMTGEKRADVEIPTGETGFLSPDQRFLVQATVAMPAGPDQQFLAKIVSKTTIWNADDGTKYAEFPGAYALVFADDGRWLAVNGKESPSVCVWDIAEQQEKFRVRCNTPVPFPPTDFNLQFGAKALSFDSCFSLSGDLLAVADGPTVRLWDIVAEKERFQLAGHKYPVFALAISPDDRMLASLASSGSFGGIPAVGDNVSVLAELRLWDTASGKLLASVPLQDLQEVFFPLGHGIPLMHFHPSGDELVLGKDYTFRVKNLMAERLIRIAEVELRAGLVQPGIFNLSRFSPDPSCEIYNPNGNRVVRYDRGSGAIHVRDRTGDSVQLTPEAGPISMGIAPDGATLFTASNYTPVSLPAPISWVREMLSRVKLIDTTPDAPFQLEMWDLPSRKLVGVVPLKSDFYVSNHRVLTTKKPVPKMMGAAGIPAIAFHTGQRNTCSR